MHVTKIGIDGMMCGQCESHVSELLRRIDGALVIKASHLKNSVTIYSPKEIAEEEVEKALEGSGYRALSFKEEVDDKEPFSYRLKAKKYAKSHQ